MTRRLVLGAAAAISALTIGFVTQQEGTKYRAYLDSANIPTICVGHTGPEVHMGMVATEYECQAYLKQDLAIANVAVSRAVRVPINDNQRAALISLTFNIGETAFERSTLLRKLNAGDYEGAAREFPKWDKARVRGALVPVRGLTERRLREAALFRKVNK
jgi:lysozyme